jgi:hypothetical protein
MGHAFATHPLFCHSEPCEESLLFVLVSISEIPRTARNDNFALAIVVVAVVGSYFLASRRSAQKLPC